MMKRERKRRAVPLFVGGTSHSLKIFIKCLPIFVVCDTYTHITITHVCRCKIIYAHKYEFFHTYIENTPINAHNQSKQTYVNIHT